MRVAEGHPDRSEHVTFLSGTLPARHVDAIQITRNGVPIARRNRPQRAPEVEHVRVRAHEDDDKNLTTVQPRRRSAGILVTWHTERGSKAPRTVKLDYSVDGGRAWRPIFMGPDRGRVSLRPQLLATSRHARIRVRVSDGFNEVSAVSAPFRTRGFRPMASFSKSGPP
jgi:hypothetical protein